jgi:hypothetical protein
MRFRTPRLALTGYALAVACLALHVLGIGLLPLPAVGYPLVSSLVAALAWVGWRRHDQLVRRLDASMAALSGAMAGPPQGLEGTVTLQPLGAPAEGGALDLSLSLSGRLGEVATAAPSVQMPAKEKAVGEVKERGFDVRI